VELFLFNCMNNVCLPNLKLHYTKAYYIVTKTAGVRTNYLDYPFRHTSTLTEFDVPNNGINSYFTGN
jgi:hypothetical protein